MLLPQRPQHRKLAHPLQQPLQLRSHLKPRPALLWNRRQRRLKRKCDPPLGLIECHLAASCFNGTTLFLALQALFLSNAIESAFGSFFGQLLRFGEQGRNPLASVCSVSFLRAKAPRGENNFTAGSHLTACQLLESRKYRRRKAKRINVQPNLHRRRDLIDVLSSWTRGSNEALAQSNKRAFNHIIHG
jgi:hypothetical protein